LSGVSDVLYCAWHPIILEKEIVVRNVAPDHIGRRNRCQKCGTRSYWKKKSLSEMWHPIILEKEIVVRNVAPDHIGKRNRCQKCGKCLAMIRFQ